MTTDISAIFEALTLFSIKNLIMILVGGVLIYLAVKKEFEPVLLLPIGFGAILANLPLTGITDATDGGFLGVLYQAGIKTELFPLLIFIGIGAMTDFGPLLENPKMALLGAAGQVGIFGTLLLALILDLTSMKRPRSALSALLTDRLPSMFPADWHHIYWVRLL